MGAPRHLVSESVKGGASEGWGRFFPCSVLLQGQVYPEGERLRVPGAGGADEAWGRKRDEACGGCLHSFCKVSGYPENIKASNC